MFYIAYQKVNIQLDSQNYKCITYGQIEYCVGVTKEHIRDSIDNLAMKSFVTTSKYDYVSPQEILKKLETDPSKINVFDSIQSSYHSTIRFITPIFEMGDEYHMDVETGKYDKIIRDRELDGVKKSCIEEVNKLRKEKEFYEKKMEENDRLEFERLKQKYGIDD